ncbi:hypothetical protein BH09PAT2_BH09PAT2_10370 [soil metagenome]
MKSIIKILIILEILVALSSFLGGWGLMMQDGMHLPKSWLAGSPFVNYFIPGLILFFIVGGSNILGAWSLLFKKRFAVFFSIIAGFGLIIWITTELFIIHQSNYLQAIYFTIGICILAISFILESGKKVRSSFD